MVTFSYFVIFSIVVFVGYVMGRVIGYENGLYTGAKDAWHSFESRLVTCQYCLNILHGDGVITCSHCDHKNKIDTTFLSQTVISNGNTGD